METENLFEHGLVFLCETFDDYSKAITYCIERDILTWRCYWDNRTNDTCYHIEFDNKRVEYGSMKFYKDQGYSIYKPLFDFDGYGTIKLIGLKKVEE